MTKKWKKRWKRHKLRGSWRYKEATEKQKKLLELKGLYEEGMTRGEASDIIAALLEKYGDEEK